MPIPTYAHPIYRTPALSTITWVQNCAMGISGQLSGSAPTSAIYTTANLGISWPFVIEKTVTIYKFFVENGTVVSGNFDIGVYSKDYKKIVTTGTTVQSGTSAIQQVTLGSPQILTPGQYFMMFSCDNITATFFQQAFSSGIATIMLCKQMASAFVLPATFTPANSASNSFPVYGAKLVNV